MGFQHVLPIAVLVGYAVLTIGVVNVVLRKKLGADHFLVAARTLPLTLVVAVVGGDMLGGAATIGVSQRGYTDGIVASLYAFSLGAAFFVFGATMASRYRRLRAVTVPEIVGRLFDERTRLVAAFVIGIAYFSIGVSQIIAGGALLTSLFGTGPRISNLIAAAVFALIIVAGGLRSIALTNVIQLAVMLLGIGVSCVFSLIDVGGSVGAGLGRLWTDLPPSFWAYDAGSPLTVGGEVIGTVFTLFAAQAAITGFLAAKDDRTAVRGAWVTGIVVAATGIPMALIGMCARLHFGASLPHGATAAPAMMLALPPVVASLSMCGLLAAIVSTGPLCFLAPIQIGIRDLFLPRARQAPSDRMVVLTSRLLAVVLLACGWTAASAFEGILSVVIWAFALRAGIAVILLSVTYLGTRRVSEAGAFWGLITGAVVFASWTVAGTPMGLHGAIPSMAANFAVTLLVSRLRRRRVGFSAELNAAMYPGEAAMPLAEGRTGW